MSLMMQSVLWFWIITYGFLDIAESVQFYLGDCPVYFEEPCNSETVKFILSVGGDNETYHDLNPFQPQLPTGYNILTPLKIVVHGYGGLTIDSASTNVTKAYQDIGYNVILVDWQALSPAPCYVAAYLNTWHVGQCLSFLTINLIGLGLGPHFTHVIGFSLGAHVAGFAGKNLKNTLGYSFMRITGLDPALPFFATFKNDWKLDSDDAAFVDVIHTSAGTFGKLEAMGHVDFYVNGGSLQPYCHNAKYPPICSHLLAGVYFAESIRNLESHFIGMECSNVANYILGFCNSGSVAMMGEYTPFTVRGIYYVRTSDKPPFALSFI
ncbi:hypothetical protein JTB14_005588 [Gonioctena quinquepunctata]|nr:hypothetical protein JTB14_005588 [Gonioctena quinquepunctata]